MSREDYLKQLRTAMQFVYIIRNTSFDDVWYFFNMKEETSYNGLLWTPHMMRAKAFPTEQSVEEFKSRYVSPRKVDIVRVDVKKL